MAVLVTELAKRGSWEATATLAGIVHDCIEGDWERWGIKPLFESVINDVLSAKDTTSAIYINSLIELAFWTVKLRLTGEKNSLEIERLMEGITRTSIVTETIREYKESLKRKKGESERGNTNMDDPHTSGLIEEWVDAYEEYLKHPEKDEKLKKLEGQLARRAIDSNLLARSYTRVDLASGAHLHLKEEMRSIGGKRKERLREINEALGRVKRVISAFENIRENLTVSHAQAAVSLRARAGGKATRFPSPPLHTLGER